jgi:DNA-binding transcriptional regulator/RsmH inhibitor MraZ
VAERTPTALPAFGHVPFSGWVNGRLEPNGRLIIPAAFRYAFTEGLLYLRARRTECLVAYTPTAFRLLVDDALATNSGGVVDPRMRQDVFMFAPKASIDRQFRVVLPSELRELIPFGEEVVFGGQIEALHIYPAETFARIRERRDAFDLLLDSHPGLSTDPA